jgi:hypothetical protein
VTSVEERNIFTLLTGSFPCDDDDDDDNDDDKNNIKEKRHRRSQV